MLIDPTTAHDAPVSRHDAALSPCRLWLGQTAGLRQLTLGNGLVRAEILLDKGANVRQFWHVPTETRTLAETTDSTEQLAAFARNGRRGRDYCDFFEGGWQDVLPVRWPSSMASGTSAIAPQPDADGEMDAGVGKAAIVPWELTRSLCPSASASALCNVRLPDCGLEVVKRCVIR